MTRILLVLFLLLFPIHGIFAGAEGANWSYEGDDGPEHWGDLSPDYYFCKDGKNQSPVDLVADLHPELPELIFNYHGTPVHETHNGHSIQLKVNPGNFLEVPARNERFELLQGHFHSPSEHTVGGEYFAMEIHLVHADNDGGLVVVGIMINEGEENPMLNRIWSFMPEKEGETRESPLSVFEAGVLPPTQDYFAYSGSLTTPPCTEGVRWIVLRYSLTASADQIARFKERVGSMTNRPVQDNNARLILD
jgi:carbonic anhydrase